jgi:hypothetical protein
MRPHKKTVVNDSMCVAIYNMYVTCIESILYSFSVLDFCYFVLNVCELHMAKQFCMRLFILSVVINCCKRLLAFCFKRSAFGKCYGQYGSLVPF